MVTPTKVMDPVKIDTKPTNRTTLNACMFVASINNSLKYHFQLY